MDHLAPLRPLAEVGTPSENTPALQEAPHDFALPPAASGHFGLENAHTVTLDDEPEINLSKLDRESNYPLSFVLNTPIDQQTLSHQELRELLSSFNKCLQLRDKYMASSLQRLGDNPRDHDGVFKGFAEDLGGVSGVRPDVYATLRKNHGQSGQHPPLQPASRQFTPWEIYPKPPPPHWHWTAKAHQGESVPIDDQPQLVSDQGEGDGFEFSHFKIPGVHDWHYHLDHKGVFQIYSTPVQDGT